VAWRFGNTLVPCPGHGSRTPPRYPDTHTRSHGACKRGYLVGGVARTEIRQLSQLLQRVYE
jgi:hypothetical protein